MKKNILFLIIISSPLFTQETNYSLEKSGNKITAPYISIFTRIIGLSYLSICGGLPNSSQGLSISGLEFTIGRKLFFYTDIGFTTGFGSETSLIWNRGVFIGIGVGGYLLDKRNTTGKGHSLILQGGFSEITVFDFSVNNNSEMLSFPMGVEIMLNYQYSFLKNTTLKVGVNLLFYSTKYVIQDDPFIPSSVNRGISIGYGLNIGFAF